MDDWEYIAPIKSATRKRQEMEAREAELADRMDEALSEIRVLVQPKPDNGYAHRDRVRKRTAFKRGVMFRAARKVMR